MNSTNRQYSGLLIGKVFDNEHSNSQSLCLDKVLILVLDTYIYEEIQWFIYDWKPGFTITVDNRAPYTIFTVEDYLEYVKENYEWE